MGKTALTLSMARNIAVDQGFPVAFFSLEMSSVQLITRLISSETGLSSEKLRTGKLEQHEWEQQPAEWKHSRLAQLQASLDGRPSARPLQAAGLECDGQATLVHVERARVLRSHGRQAKPTNERTS